MTIYMITNTKDGKAYIGQTTESVQKRWYKHCSKDSRCTYLKRAIELHGKSAFKIEALEECSSIEELNYLEAYYINSFGSLAPNGYNLTSGGEGFTRSQVTAQKISAANKGRKRTETVKQAIRTRMLGSKCSAETRAKMSLARKGKPSPLKGRAWSPARRAAQERQNDNK